ncbi:uncharacterized protein EDB93DRAFT_1324706 [Suillus bovinus]|uniref:uncharacterized protein n=1 Tax=Suillus bovinus TaxID=48563 RepID=UPI001B88421D|nr:uncharacterized protein EDB93DRAFT_1324706 [Suillus bovinus]KAG2159248.1 hypothetical protein EDB93DRAFT_1324706 [Suillus bovinus]
MSFSKTSNTAVDADHETRRRVLDWFRYRHAAPSGPWPWLDFNVDLALSEPPFRKGEHEWRGYPQELFGNWSPNPVKRSKMLTQCALNNETCVVYGIDLTGDGEFKTREKQQDRKNIRVRALFVDNLSEPVLKMLGTKYIVEPFFFSSSTNWIPSRYREDVRHGSGDHITVILPFIRTTEKRPSSLPKQKRRRDTIDVMSPLHLHDGEHVQILLIDLLAIHMIRDKKSSTIISYHPTLPDRTTAERLYQVMERAGGSVYWSKIFKASEDPTFFFLAILWYALYAWDETFEVLYNHIKELEVILNDYNFKAMDELNYDLHSLLAHLLQYQTLLHDFEISVKFVEETPNPAMEHSDNMRTTKELMERECKNLLAEIDRLHRRCGMFISRLKNATDLAFATVNIQDSRQTSTLTRATLRDSAAMKQISYLTMIFLPASFTASVFGMNVREINPGSLESIKRYVWVSFLLTLVTTWVVVAVQPYTKIHEDGAGVWRRAAWPVFFLSRIIIEYFKSFSIKGKKTSPQEDDIPLGSYHNSRTRLSSSLKLGDVVLERVTIGG